MSSKHYLSEKKNTRITITTSAALKDWIERYIKKELKNKPSDERLKSLSSFCHETLENVMKIYELGKTLDDFERLINLDVKEFFDQLSTNVYLPYIEIHIESARYKEIDYNKMMRILMLSRQFYMKSLDPHDINSLYKTFDRIKGRYFETGITKSLDIEITPINNSKHYKCIIEHIGLAKGGFPVNNIHIGNCKVMLQMMGFLGCKVTNLDISYSDLYYRFEMITTELFFQKQLLKKQRINLVKDNVRFLVNYNRIIEDEDHHFWIKLASSQSCFVEFKSDKAFNEWISIVEKDIEDFDIDYIPKIKILKFFEKIHWITLSEDQKSFTFELAFGLSDETVRRLLEYLEKNFIIETEGDTFFISKTKS